MDKSVEVAIIGFIGAFAINILLAWFNVTSWIQADCAEEGPDYIKAKLKSRLAFLILLSVAILFVFILVDLFFFSGNGMLRQAINKAVSDWGDEGQVAWPLWIGALIGLPLGSIAGGIWALASFRKSKCTIPFLG